MKILPTIQRKFNSISLYVTTLCNFHCDHCCAEGAIKTSMTIEEMQQLTQTLGPVQQLVITGGEPTLHKQFKELLQEITKLEYDKLILASNGYKVLKYWDQLHVIDELRISHYIGQSTRKQEDNTDLIQQILAKEGGPKRTVIQKITMVGNDPNKHKPCGRESNGIASYFNGKIYGCCVAAGMKESNGEKYDKNWRTTAINDHLPCGDCVFAY